MHLTRYSDYAMRVLIALAATGERRTTIGEIAARYDISRNHLLKVCHHLQQLGYIEGIRGKGGGLRLIKDPASIRVGDLFRQTEPSLELVECFGAGSSCLIMRACRLQPMLAGALDAFFDALNRHTLADVLENASRLAGLFEPPVSSARSRSVSR